MTVIDSATRFSTPTSAPRRRRWRRLLLAVLLAVVVGAAVWLVWWSPVLAVREVRVLGARTVSAEQVREVADVRLGTPMARVSEQTVAARVETIPVVGSVEVRYGWPDVLVLVVTERTAVAVVRDGAGYRLVDQAGLAYLPVVRAPEGLPTVRADGPALAAAVQVVDGLPSPLRARVAAVRAGSVDDVELTLKDGTRVRWGGVADSGRKAAVVQALLVQGATLIDVTAPDLPTTRGGERTG